MLTAPSFRRLHVAAVKQKDITTGKPRITRDAANKLALVYISVNYFTSTDIFSLIVISLNWQFNVQQQNHSTSLLLKSCLLSSFVKISCETSLLA